MNSKLNDYNETISYMEELYYRHFKNGVTLATLKSFHKRAERLFYHYVDGKRFERTRLVYWNFVALACSEKNLKVIVSIIDKFHL